METWRRLSGGRVTTDADRRSLIACSAGADSSALVLALSNHPGSLAVGHVVHDMRPIAESHADRDACQSLAASLGIPFVSVSITPKASGGNYEASARRLRYKALADLAAEAGCRYVATAHHADDQLETVLMRLLRGSGPQGFAGIRPRRAMGGGIQLIRPMLGVTHSQAQALCNDCGWSWREDATNRDISRLRAALRSGVLPALLKIEPNAPAKAIEAAELAALTATHLESQQRQLHVTAGIPGSAGEFDRATLRAADEIVLLSWLRAMSRSSSDAVPQRALRAAAGAIRSKTGNAKACLLGAVEIHISGDRVRVGARIV